MNRTLLSIFFVSLSIVLCFSTTYNSVKDGSWSAANVWSAGGPPGNGDEGVVNHQINYDITSATPDAKINSGCTAGSYVKVTSNSATMGKGTFSCGTFNVAKSITVSSLIMNSGSALIIDASDFSASTSITINTGTTVTLSGNYKILANSVTLGASLSNSNTFQTDALTVGSGGVFTNTGTL